MTGQTQAKVIPHVVTAICEVGSTPGVSETMENDSGAVPFVAETGMLSTERPTVVAKAGCSAISGASVDTHTAQVG